jgi:putative membrane protein
VLVLPFVLRLLWLARSERFDEHRRLARFVFPVWAYVSVTGLVVYILLYQVYGYV